MHKLVLLPATVAALLPALLAAGPAAAQAKRTWVASYGDDGNPCNRNAPCSTFAGALSKTAAGGEISVIDPAGYGAVQINKSITINGMWGGEAGVLAVGTNGVIVNAASTEVIVLRGLTIEGAGTGLSGVRVLGAGAVHIQDSIIQNFRSAGANHGNGVTVVPAFGTLELTLTNTLLQNNGAPGGAGGGVFIRPNAGAGVKATLTRVQALNNTAGVVVDGDVSTGGIDVAIRDSDLSGNAAQGLVSISPNNSDSLVRVTIADSTVANNGTFGAQSVGQQSTVRIGGSTVTGNGGPGLQANNQGILQSYGDNYAEGNGAANVGVTPAPPS